MTATSYNDISTANSVKLLNTFSMYNEYIMLFTEIDSHIEKGDRVYITIVGDVGELSEDSIILDNLYSSNIDTLYNDTLQGYSVIFVDKSKNAVVINKKASDITSSDNISDYNIENQYISKISIHNIIVDKCTINGATIKYGIINNTKNDGDVNWIQGNIFGGEIYNTVIDNKYDNSYITLKKFESMSYVFTANNTEIGLSDGYSYFYNIIIQDSIITNGNFIDCDLQNTKTDTGDYFIEGGYFNGCNYVGYHINNGYHKNIIDLDRDSGCMWNNGYFDCPETGYSFNLDYWYNGTFVRGLFGGANGQKCNNPIWVNGIFSNGIFDSYRWENGEFNNGIFGTNGIIGKKTTNTYDAFESHLGITKRRADGNLLNSTLSDNIYEYPVFVNGIINGGLFIRTKFLNTIVGNGTIVDSTILNIKNLGGLLIDCSIKTGELLGGFIRSNNLSFVINDCIISDTDINIYNKNDISLNKYKNDSEIVSNYINAYSLYSNNNTFIFINNCSLLSPICKISKENTHRIFINKQQNINGGEYENIDLTFPQIIDGGNFKTSYIGYSKDINNSVSNTVFCSVRPVRVLTNTTGTSSVIYTMFEFDNNGQKPFTTLSTGVVNLYGCIYTKLANNGTGNNTILDVLNLNILGSSNKYDPRKYNDNTGAYDNIISYTDTYIILDLLYEDYMFGDFCILYLGSSGYISDNDKYVINGGKFEKCELIGNSGDVKMTINGGVFDNTNFNGYTIIESCNFNGGKISGNSNEWNGGNFNSGTFGVPNQPNEIYELQLKNGSKAYFLNRDGNKESIDTIDGEMTLSDIYPLIITRNYTNNNNFDSIGNLHDEEYQEYYLDIWNESGIDFTGTTGVSNEAPWSDKIIDTDNYLIIPSHFVFIIKNTKIQDYHNMLSFIQLKVDIDVLDVRLGKYNTVYNNFYEDINGKIPVNDFQTEYIGYYTDDRKYSIAIVIKFNKIEEMYNNTLNKNQQWFNNIFKDYNLYYKNIWAEANAGYFVRPMPVYDTRPRVRYETITITGDYGNYPVPQYNNHYIDSNLPAPWHCDNNGKLWLPLHQSSIRDKYDIYKTNINNYTKNYFKNTDEILPFKYFEFKKNIKSEFNTYLPLTKKVKKDYITDSIELNSNIDNYINMNMGDKNILQIDTWLYKGGWETYKDVPYNFKTERIVNIEESWLYIEQFYGIDKTTLEDTINSNMKLLHIVSHNHDFVYDYIGPARILSRDYVMGASNLHKVKIDKKISNNYGHAFIVDCNNFIFNNIDKIIQIMNFGENNYNISVGSYLYIYTPTYRGKVTISEYISLTGNNVFVKISENISITSPSPSNFVYGLDEWIIDTLNTPNNLSTNVTRLDINQDINHYNVGFNGSIVPSNEIHNNWKSSDPMFIYSESINTVKSNTIKTNYPNDYVQGKIIQIKNIKENYDGMYLYDTVFDYNVNKEADKVNVYLYDSVNIPNFNKVWLKDSVTVNVIGNSIDFNQPLKLLSGYQKLSGTVIRYNNMFSFKKTTNLFRIEADDASYPDYISVIEKMKTNKDFVQINDTETDILSGVYESNSNGYSINIESFTKQDFPVGILTPGFYTYALRSLPIDYTTTTTFTTTTTDKRRGNYIEFGKKLNNTILSPALQIEIDNNNTFIKINCDLRDTYYGKIMNLQNYINKNVILITKIGNTYFSYKGSIISSRLTSNNLWDCEVTIILNQDINKLSNIEFGYFYIEELQTDGNCYQFYTTNEIGKEITENDNFHYNSGDPSQMIYSPKQILLSLNSSVRTTETVFERQSGIVISSNYNLENGDIIDSDVFNDGNFYSGEFNGEWINGDWFAGSNAFKGINTYNRTIGKDFTKAPERKESTIKNFTEILNSLIKRGEYFMYPPWSSKERQIVVTPKITRSDEY